MGRSTKRREVDELKRSARLTFGAVLCVLTLTCIGPALGATRLDTAEMARVVGRVVENPGEWCEFEHNCWVGCPHTEWLCQPDVDPTRCHKANMEAYYHSCDTGEPDVLCRVVGIECWKRWTGTISSGTCPTGCPNYHDGDCRHPNHCIGGRF